MNPNRFFLKAIIFEGGLGIVAIILGYLFGVDFFRGMFLNERVIVAIIVLTLPLLGCYFFCRVLPFESFRAIDRLIGEIFQKYMSQLSVRQLAIISIAAGLGEELFFRALLQSGISEALINWTKNATEIRTEIWSDFCMVMILIFVSLLFGLAHAATKMYFFLAFLVSIYFGVILIVSGNIFIPIAIHAIYDFCILTFLKITQNKINLE
ncbi:MAG: CPBP family intramembrane metalloprotease [Planctomycetaceae bacterium]|jgi:membrane protease YdiL (CAAX protease family)|nr:CPBP family intramembrane metalloprotease [Planctomycetaceae bacterium]